MQKIKSQGMKERDWIKVEDRVPESDDSVLVYDDTYGVLVADYDPFWGFTNYEHGDLDHVTHWMELVLPSVEPIAK